MSLSQVISIAKKGVSNHLPLALRQRIWYLSDSNYRRRRDAETAKIHAFRTARRACWPMVWEQTGGIIASGPFAGMKYLKTPGRFTPKILGTYEKEIAGIIEEICGTEYRLIVVVGAAEGYYACGLALRDKSAFVVTFESQRQQRRNLARLADMNGIKDRLRILGECVPERLRDVLSDDGRCLIICDVDGAEFDLLRVDLVPRLLDCDILAEVHDDVVSGVSRVVADRFGCTHHIRRVTQEMRSPGDLPGQIGLDHRLAMASMDEFRGPGNDWLWIKRMPK